MMLARSDWRTDLFAGKPAFLGLLILAAPLLGASLSFPLIGLLVAIVIGGLLALYLGAPMSQIIIVGFVGTAGLNLTDIATSQFGAPSLTKYLFALMMALLLVKTIQDRRLPPMHAPGIAAIALFSATSGIAVITAFDSLAAFAAYDEQIRNAVIAVVLAILLGQFNILRSATTTLLCALAVLAAIATFQVVTGAYEDEFFGLAGAAMQHIAGRVDSYRITGPFSDPNSFGRILLIGIPFALYEYVYGRHVLHRIGAAAALAALTAALIFTFSRGALVGLFIIAILAGLRMRWLGRRLVVLTVLCAAVVAALAPEILLDRLWVAVEMIAGEAGNGSAGDESIRNRLDEMLLAARMFADHPIGGVGIGNYSQLFQQYAIAATAVFRHEDRLAHSRFLEIAAEQGIIGLAAFSAVLWTAGRALIGAAQSSDLPRRKADLAYAIGLALIGYLAASIFLHDDYPRFFWLLIGMAFAVPVAMRSDRNEQ